MLPREIAELTLPGQVWVGTRPRESARLLGSGVAEVDRLCGGGIPRGDVAEITGPRSSGRTAIAWTLLAAATRGGEVVAVVDPADALHPAALAAARARLDRVLWVRPPSLRTALTSAEWILDAGGFGAVLLDLDAFATTRLPGHVWPRLRRAARRSGTALIVLSSQPSTGSFAGLRIALQRRRLLWPRRVLLGMRASSTPQRGGVGGAAAGELHLAHPFAFAPRQERAPGER